MRFEELLRIGCAALEQTSESPRLDAEVLLSHAAGVSRSQLLARLNEEAPADDVSRYRVFMERRKACEPVAYLTGMKEFWSLEFAVNRSVLIPRPETELLVEKGLAFLKAQEGELSVLDLGTGSGCIAVSLAYELEKASRAFSVLALDTSPDALETAAENAIRHGVGGDVVLLESNWFSELDPARDRFDLIVANPPYIATGDPVPSDLRYEPQEALFAGPKGTEVIEQLMEQVSAFLNSGGIFLCEIGADQRHVLEAHFEEVQKRVRPHLGGISFYQDLAGRDRVMQVSL